MAKFTVKVGNDSVEDSIHTAVAEMLEARGLTQADPKWEVKFDQQERKLRKLVEKYVAVEGNEAVTLEFDDESTDPPRGVPLKDAVRAEKAREKARDQARRQKEKANARAQRQKDKAEAREADEPAATAVED